MLELEASLASRLHEHEEQLRKHRLLVEKQREWLVEYVPSPAHQQETQTTRAVAIKDSRPTAEGSKKIPIEERLLQKGDESRRKLESEREKMEKERLENENRILGERVVSASITPRRTAESSRALWQGMPVELTAKPQISLMSEKLAEVKRSKEGLSDVDISTSLLVRAARARGALLERETANASSPHPQITSKASALLRDGTAFERLYASRSEKISEPQEELRSLIEESLCSGVPVITAKAQALQRRAGHSVSDDLYDDARRSREQRMRRATTPPARATPRIDAVSEIIAAQLPQSSAQRLLVPKRSVVATIDAPFAPSISKASARIASQRENNTPRHEVLHRDSYRRATRTHEQSASKAKSELENCTFHPIISTRAANSRLEASAFERMSKWQQRRDQRIEDERIKQLADEEKQCTFVPSTNPAKATVVDIDIYGGDGRAWGFHDFVDRQQTARKMRDEEQHHVAASFTDGSNWSRTTTRPQIPNISAFHQSSGNNKQSQAHIALSLAMNALREAEAVTALE
ncbi:Hypothetical protein, putative [Bodo saltans]|uniref:Uncharacterized protein n=1 Tax=Bodo saltans TaxID=75058 RepID=A0A0S4JQK5_BODSA|nr:Hypothetical protein, putative [Bodo saltans]|eukprot:CUG92470.1 Hypothetical protein, putative [Bodo saltans]